MDRNSFVPENTSFFKRSVLGIRDYISFILRFIKIVKQKKYSAVHITSSGSLGLIRDIILLKILHAYKIKSIIHFRFGRIPELSKKCNWEWKLLKKVILNSSQVIVIDNKTYKVLDDLYFPNINYLPNPLSISISNYIKNNLKEYRLKRRILFAGHLFMQKGIFEFIEGCSNIDNIEVVIAGKGSPQIEQNIRDKFKSGYNSHIQLLGEITQKELLSEMLKCHMFVFPSYTEGFPNVILEAMACGCPIIATDVGAIPEMLQFGTESPCGIWIPVKEAVSVKNEIKKLLADNSLCTELSRRASNRAFSEYGIETIWKQMESIWAK